MAVNFENLKQVCPVMSSIKHEEETFRLVWIQNMALRLGHNPFRVLFRSDNGHYIYEDIVPELLSYYTIGSYYKKGKLQRYRKPEGETFEIFSTAETNRFELIRKLMSKGEYPLNDRWDRFDNGRQNCAVFEDARSIVIIPCAVIGATFYFRSTSMRAAVLGGQEADSLFAEAKCEKDIVHITPKSDIAEEAIAHVARFCFDKYAKKRWEYIHTDIVSYSGNIDESRPNPSVPFSARIPVERLPNMKVRGLRFGMPDGREKILVFDILQEDSPLPFTKLILVKHSSDESGPEDGFVPNIATKSKELKDSEASRNMLIVRILQRIPEKNNCVRTNKNLVEYEFQPKEGQSKATIIDGEKDEPGYISLTKSGLPADRPTSPGEAASGETESSRDKLSESERRSSYRWFFALVEALKAWNEVKNIATGEGFVPEWKKKKKSHALVKRAGLSENERRDYRSVTFSYGSRDSCLIEINPQGLTVSVFVLTADGSTNLRPHINTLLQAWVEQVRFAKMPNSLPKHVKCSRHSHPRGSGKESMEITDDAVNMWCRSLLNKISGKKHRRRSESALESR